MIIASNMMLIFIFQSTHSIRSATVDFMKFMRIMRISIHALHTECDLSMFQLKCSNGKFQSTHSIRSATCIKSSFGTGSISIHALHTECDTEKSFDTMCHEDFNPRTPYGVRPQRRKFDEDEIRISIHALHTECDMTLLFVPGTPP